MNPGLFISFEGIEGCGKSTQMRLLREHVEAFGRTVVMAREPGGTAVGDRVRAILLDAELMEMVEEAEMHLFAASRAQLVRQVVRPALERGDVVLCDRYVHSSLAYQGHARGLGPDLVRSANAAAIDGLLPQRVVLLDLSPDEALARAAVRSPDADRIEGEQLSFHRAVRAGFLAEAERDPERFARIDANGDAEQVHRRVVEALAPLLQAGAPS
jgi:dTMP kinase